MTLLRRFDAWYFAHICRVNAEQKARAIEAARWEDNDYNDGWNAGYKAALAAEDVRARYGFPSRRSDWPIGARDE